LRLPFDLEALNNADLETAFGQRQLEAMADYRHRVEKAEEKALRALYRVKPTTPAEAAALTAYVVEDMKDGTTTEWHSDALANVARTLKGDEVNAAPAEPSA
jgi:hypothetical protein